MECLDAGWVSSAGPFVSLFEREVLVSTLSLIASAKAIRHVNAWPVFMDAEVQHWQMDAPEGEGSSGR